MTQNTGHNEDNNMRLSLGIVYYFNESLETVYIRGWMPLHHIHIYVHDWLYGSSKGYPRRLLTKLKIHATCIVIISHDIILAVTH